MTAPPPIRPIPGTRGSSPFGETSSASEEGAPLAPPVSAPAPVVATGPAAAPSASRRAGAAVILAGVGVGTGALLGGLWGAGSGLFVSGAAINAFRAHALWKDPAEQGEAVKTTVMAVLGLGLAGYLGYRSRQAADDD